MTPVEKKRMANGNGTNGTFKWIAGTAFTVIIFLAGIIMASSNAKIDTVKADSVQALKEHEDIKGHKGMVDEMNKLQAQRRVDSTVTDHWRAATDTVLNHNKILLEKILRAVDP